RPFIRPMWHPRSPKDIMAPATVARNRSATDTLERVTELSPTLFDLGTRADAENRFPDESMRLLVEAGVARAPLPRALGGDELDARALVALVSTVSAADPGLGLVVAMHVVHARRVFLDVAGSTAVA